MPSNTQLYLELYDKYMQLPQIEQESPAGERLGEELDDVWYSLTPGEVQDVMEELRNEPS